jgi:DNA anti-recombination protein RmuC
VNSLDSIVDWDELVSALRDELQEKGGLIRLLNHQTEALYRRDHVENERLEDQIRNQIRLATRCRQTRDLILRQTAAKLDMPDDAPAGEILARFPEYVQPLLEALFLEVDRLSARLEERLRQNQQLKGRFMVEIAPAT